MTSLIDHAVGRSRTVLAILVFILIAGSFAYRDIPKESQPDISIPIIYVTVSHDGISPEDAERLIIRPLEQEMRGIEGIKEMRSTGYEGGANVLLEFEAGFDADTALQDVREQVDVAKSSLPAASEDPEVHEVNFSPPGNGPGYSDASWAETGFTVRRSTRSDTLSFGAQTKG